MAKVFTTTPSKARKHQPPQRGHKLNKRTEILETAKHLVNGDRADAYGPPEENFKRIADGWSVILQADVSAEQVALCMAWLKIARLVNSSTQDGYVDGAAYIALAAELAE
jgi:hypothetical protein